MPISKQRALNYVEFEWATYTQDFQRLDSEKQHEFLSKQGFASFHDLLAHIAGWWDCRFRRGARIIHGIVTSPAFTWQEVETDSFNAALIQKFSMWPDDDLLHHYEGLRLALIDLVESLPEDAFLHKDIEGWLADDVVHHYDDHPIPA